MFGAQRNSGKRKNIGIKIMQADSYKRESRAIIGVNRQADLMMAVIATPPLRL